VFATEGRVTEVALKKEGCEVSKICILWRHLLVRDKYLMSDLDEQCAKRKEINVRKRGREDARREKRELAKLSREEQRHRLSLLRTEFLTHSSLDRFVEKLFTMALDDDHSGQAVAIKLIAERILPIQSFTAESKKSSAVNINISGLKVDVSEEKDVSEPVSIQ
jgi:hypothetical protein